MTDDLGVLEERNWDAGRCESSGRGFEVERRGGQEEGVRRPEELL